MLARGGRVPVKHMLQLFADAVAEGSALGPCGGRNSGDREGGCVEAKVRSCEPARVISNRANQVSKAGQAVVVGVHEHVKDPVG